MSTIRSYLNVLYGIFLFTSMEEKNLFAWEPNKGERLVVILNKLSSAPIIDGDLSEPCWKEAIKLTNFTTVQPKEGTKPEVETEVLLGYDSDFLYIGFICDENNISTIRATKGPRDAISNNEDRVSILLDPFKKFQKAYEFHVNPYGKQQDAYQNNYTDISFDTEWKAGGRIFQNKWMVEIAIPFKSIRFPNASEQHWKINFFRNRPRESRQMYSWAPISLNEPFLLTQSGDLYIKEKIGHKSSIEFLPYIAGAYNGTTFDTINIKSKYGIGSKYNIFSDVVLDFTINPDYSQIETDAPQIDVNTTFALYYPEKRPFFFEGMDMYKHLIDIVYTRSINDPILAGKFTGRVKNTSIGYITAYDNHTPWIIPFREYSFPITSSLNSFSNILRIKQSILKDSYVGITATSRDIQNSYYNRIASIDSDIRFLTHYDIKFQLTSSWYMEPNDTTVFAGFPWLKFNNYTSAFDGERFNGIAYKYEFYRLGRVLNFGAWYSGVSSTFRADNGFIYKNDFKRINGWTNLDFRINKNILERVSPFLNIGREYNYVGEWNYEYINPYINVTLIGQTYLSLYYNLSSQVFKETKFKNMYEIGGNISTNFSKFFSIGIWGQTGDEINYYSSPPSIGDRYKIGNRLSLKPIPKLIVGLNSQRYWLLGKDTTIYDVTVLQNKINYQFTKHLGIRFITQYSSKERKIEFYPLLSFEYNPFTVFYLGSNHTFNEFDSPYRYKESERRIFVKFSYLLKL